jgi:hypothetical protein
MRTFTAAVNTALQSTNYISCELVEFGLDTPLYLTTALWDITTSTVTSGGSQTYISQGNFLAFSGFGESTELRINNVNVTFSAATNLFVDVALSDNYLHRPIAIYKQFFNTTSLALIADPVLIYRGTITGASIQDSQSETTVTFDTSNQFYDFDREAGRRTNTGSQQRHFPGDLGFQYSTVEISDLRWGRV